MAPRAIGSGLQAPSPWPESLLVSKLLIEASTFSAVQLRVFVAVFQEGKAMAAERTDGALPYSATLKEYQQQAEALFAALASRSDEARWRFKWSHPRFRGRPVDEVRPETLDVADAQLVVANQYGFDNWGALVEFTEVVTSDAGVARFEAAVEAVISGDIAALRSLMRDHPELARAQSTRSHHATLLHYIGANGVEDARQRTPGNAVDVAKELLDAGADVDALADLYGARCTTMSMLVSSAHPAQAGLQAVLAGILLDYGAALDGRGSKWQSALMTALAFGYLPTASLLADRGSPVDSVAAAAGLGRFEDTVRLLPGADALSRHVALALSAQHGHVPIVRLLIDAGEDPNRYNPDGYHSHSTPLHQAVSANHIDVVKLLVARGARLDIRDSVYGGTPLGWALYGSRADIADYLRARGAPMK